MFLRTVWLLQNVHKTTSHIHSDTRNKCGLLRPS